MKTGSAPSQQQKVWTRVDRCRICGGTELLPVLDLGEQAIGNAFRALGDAPPAQAPLCLVRCAGCDLVQLRHRVDSALMYSRYWYRSGVNKTMRDHLAGLAAQARAISALSPHDVVIDIGCNDGTTLGAYPQNVTRIGVDPSNIECANCDVRVRDYFSFDAVRDALGGRRVKVITSIAMFYDLDDPRAFAADIRRCLRDDGVWILELSYLPAMLRAVAYDTICHEHVCYYSLATFERVLESTGLAVFDVEFNQCNGGSFRLFVAPEGTRARSGRHTLARAEEARVMLGTEVPYETFRARVEQSKRDLREFLDRARAEGATVWGYGASTKGMVTLQHCGVTAHDLIAIAERNPDKYGLLTPGSDVPIRSEGEMRDAAPDYLLVLPWHFMAEFEQRESDYLAAGGKLVAPLPEFAVIGAHGSRGER